MQYQNTKAFLPHLSQQYQSDYDLHPIFSQIGGYVADVDTGELLYKLDKNDWTKKADQTPSCLTGEDGDVVVKIPAFYFKTDKKAENNISFEIHHIIPNSDGSNCPQGFKIHPAFKMANGKIRPYFTVGAYLGTEKDGKLRSISGTLPTADKTKANFIDLSRQGRSINYSIESATEWFAIQILFYTEFGTLDCQTALGKGVSDLSWEDGIGAKQNYRISGLSNSLGDRSGYIDTHGNGFSPVRYRGIENIFGNVYHFLSGCLIKDDGFYLTNEHSKMDIVDQMEHIRQDLSSKLKNSYAKTMYFHEGYEWTFFVKETDASHNTYYCDYHWSHDPGEENVVLAGGNWSSGAGCGLAYLNCANVAALLDSVIGARLSYGRQ